MTQSTPSSMPRGKFVDAEPLCGPVGMSMFGKPGDAACRGTSPGRPPTCSFSDWPPTPRMSMRS